jgi:hypothetical protein
MGQQQGDCGRSGAWEGHAAEATHLRSRVHVWVRVWVVASSLWFERCGCPAYIQKIFHSSVFVYSFVSGRPHTLFVQAVFCILLYGDVRV